MSDYQHLLIETSADGVRTITLNRPDKLNAVNRVLANELPNAVDHAAASDDVRVVVITGAGRGFCAGLDLSEPVKLDTSTLVARLDPELWVGKWVKAIAHCEKPVIAAVNGPAAGAGFGLALACDIRVIAASAKISAGYVRRGLSPDAGVSYWLPRLVGHTRAMDIVMTGRDVDSDEAFRIGIATSVVADDALAATVGVLASRMAAGPPVAMALSKRLMMESSTATMEQQLRKEVVSIKTCFATADVQEAIAAFMGKRAPKFTGR
ncbi:MAG: enoyl-CoA hydratase-related protein [Gemmatimonadaceae bacterium]